MRRPDPKRVARERRLAQQRRRAMLRIAGVAILIMAVAIGALSLYRSDVLSVARIEVEGAQRLSVDDVLVAAAVPADTTLLRFSSRDIEERLRAQPWIAEVEVHRSFPDGMRIVVIERTPAALVDLGQTLLWLVDADGLFLEAATPAADDGLIVIRDIVDIDPEAGEYVESATLDNALAVIAGLSAELSAEVRVISAPTVERTALLTVDDVEVVIGAADLIEQKDIVALRILEEQEGRAVYINVRTPDRPTWRGLDAAP